MISHVSYFDAELLINKPVEDTITIYLEPKVNTLAEIVISGKEERLTPQDFYILDFSISEGKIFVMGFYKDIKRKYTIKVLNTYLEQQQAFELPDTMLPVELFADCLNNCHILTKTSAYQIIQTDTAWGVCCNYGIDQFHKLMDDCLFKTDKHAFFKHIKMNGYAQSFYAVNLETKKRIPLIKNNDIRRYHQLIDELKFLQEHPPSINMEFEIRFVEEMMYNPFTDGLINFGDTIFYFNFKDGEIDYFSDEKLEWIGETSIDSRLNNSIWNDEVIFDKSEKKLISSGKTNYLKLTH